MVKPHIEAIFMADTKVEFSQLSKLYSEAKLIILKKGNNVNNFLCKSGKALKISRKLNLTCFT